MSAAFETNDATVDALHSVEMEQSVIGALLLENDAIDRIGYLRTEHFYRADHRLIFAFASKLILAGDTADALTVYECAQAEGKVEAIGGLAYVNDIAQSTPSAANIARYAKIVVDRWRLRKVLAAADEIRADVVNRKGAEVDTILERAQSRLERIADTRSHEPRMLTDVLHDLLSELDDERHGCMPTAIATGYRDLDAKLDGGMAPGDLVIVAGRPSMGKTAFAQGIAEHVSYTDPVLMFSLEMEAKQLARRNLARNGGIAMNRLRDGRRLLDDDWNRVTEATKRATTGRLFIDDMFRQSLLDIQTRARALKRKHGLGLIVIDYLGLMADGEGDTRSQQIGSITRGLKGLAKQLSCPVLLLAQLNRGLEHRPDRRPMMSDLRDSGEIEQDADTILFVYRDEVYYDDSPDKGVAEIIIGKQRNGAIGKVGLAYVADQTKFEDLAADRHWGQIYKPAGRVRGGIDE